MISVAAGGRTAVASVADSVSVKAAVGCTVGRDAVGSEAVGGKGVTGIGDGKTRVGPKLLLRVQETAINRMNVHPINLEIVLECMEPHFCMEYVYPKVSSQ